VQITYCNISYVWVHASIQYIRKLSVHHSTAQQCDWQMSNKHWGLVCSSEMIPLLPSSPSC